MVNLTPTLKHISLILMSVAENDPFKIMPRKDWSENILFSVVKKGYYLSMRNLSISLRGTEKNCDSIRIHMAAAYELRKVTKITTSWFNLLWFPYRAVPKADDLYLLICIVVILIQFRDAAHIASHFLQLFLFR